MAISPSTSFSFRAGNFFSVFCSGEDVVPAFFVALHSFCPERFFRPEQFFVLNILYFEYFVF